MNELNILKISAPWSEWSLKRLHIFDVIWRTIWASQVAQWVKESTCNAREVQIRSLGQEDPLEDTATHSSISAWRIPWTQEPGRIQPTGSQRVGHAEVSEHTCMHYIACFRYESEVAQSCPTLCDPMDCSRLGSSIHGIFQARILEWVAISFSSGSSQPRDQTRVSFIVGRCFYRLSHQGGP